MIPTAGKTSSSDILIPRPQENAIVPRVQALRWNKNIVNQRKKTAKQSLKHLKTNMLWSRFDAINKGKT